MGKTTLLQDIDGSKNMHDKYCCDTKPCKKLLFISSRTWHALFCWVRVPQGYVALVPSKMFSFIAKNVFPLVKKEVLGNLFSSIAKNVFPLVKKEAKTLGKQVLQSGVEFSLDVLSSKNAKQAAIDQAKTVS